MKIYQARQPLHRMSAEYARLQLHFESLISISAAVGIDTYNAIKTKRTYIAQI